VGVALPGAVGEPICMIVPVPRGFCEQMIPRIVPLAANPELLEEYKDWEARRVGFLKGLCGNDRDTAKQGWQKEYLERVTAIGSRKGHCTRLVLKGFEREQDAS
jgi:hypothetical protein